MHNLSQHQVLKIAVLMILEGCSWNVAIGEWVCVFHHDTISGNVVMPVGRLIIIQKHDRRDGDVYP